MSTPTPTPTVKSPIFREYIGVKEYPDNFEFPTEIINEKIPEFHFILGFATEDYDDDKKGTGNFEQNWNVDILSADNVKNLKKDHPNVKVIISIGGRGADYPFNPAKKEEWIDNAVESIKVIIDGYGDTIDGIDINYEEVKSSDADFSHCIGKLITKVKEQVQNINWLVVSIAPSHLVSSHYKRLYRDYKNHIDYVDYQFYNEKVSSKNDFVRLFKHILHDYDSHKLLAGYSTDSNDAHGVMSGEVFIEGCKQLFNGKLLTAGIFLWNANDSALGRSNNTPFYLEKKMQKILTHTD